MSNDSKLDLFVLGVSSVNSCTSIYSSQKHLLCDIDKCLNSFYYTMILSDYLILFVFDDFLITKEGDCFEAKGHHLFDHTAKIGKITHAAKLRDAVDGGSTA